MSPVHPSSTPPTHAIFLISIVGALCLISFPNIFTSLDDAATIDACTSPLFPDIISRKVLGVIRVVFAVFIFAVSLYRSTETELLQPNLMKHSKLRSLPFDAGGIRAQWFFTSWSWNLLGLYFATSGYTTLLVDRYVSKGLEMPDLTWELRACFLLYSTVAPTTMLTSFIVTYVLWDRALSGNGSDKLKRIAILLQHNANVFLSLLEVGILGGLKLRFIDIAVAPLFGIAYVLFAWSIRFRWHPSGAPQFPYFFLDTTLGKTTSIALIGLVTVLLICYVVFNALTILIGVLEGGFIVNLVIVVGITSLLVRFRD